MSTATETQPKRERSLIYIITIVVLVVLGVIATVMFLTARQEVKSQDKAEELIQVLSDAGVDVNLTAEQISRVLGNDGGAVCANPNDALSRAVLLDRIANGASGPGIRPIITDTRYLQGQVLIMQVYCPNEVEEFQQFVDSLELTDTGN
ncbi:hypothetical protein [Acidovorax sp. SLBN-42]